MNFQRLNSLAESILEVLFKNRANPENLTTLLKCDKPKLGENMRFLLDEGYIKNCNPKHAMSTEVHPRDDYRITVSGENYLSNVNLSCVKDNRQFWINLANAAVSLTALIKAFWNEISAVLPQLAQ